MKFEVVNSYLGEIETGNAKAEAVFHTLKEAIDNISGLDTYAEKIYNKMVTNNEVDEDEFFDFYDANYNDIVNDYIKELLTSFAYLETVKIYDEDDYVKNVVFVIDSVPYCYKMDFAA